MLPADPFQGVEHRPADLVLHEDGELPHARRLEAGTFLGFGREDFFHCLRVYPTNGMKGTQNYGKAAPARQALITWPSNSTR